MRTWTLTAMAGPMVFSALAMAGGIRIDHTNSDPSTLSQATMDRIGSQMTIFFAHASVGTNMISGLNALHSQNAGRYQLTVAGDDATPPATLTGGTFYEFSRGNPGWSAKISGFSSSMAGGWGNKVGVAMNKFCYIDPNADFATYRDSMAGLQAAYPDTKFVYMTIPLMTSAGSDGYKRQLFNDALRQFCCDNDKILFDIADIEAWSPAGVQQTAVYNGQTCQILFGDYTNDGGHLDSDGQLRVAQGLYSLFGALVPEPASLTLLLPGASLLLKRRAAN